MNREPRFPSRPKGHKAPPTAPRHAGGFRRWWWLACAGWLITLATPAQVVKLLDYTNAVRFNYTENLDGVAWAARDFDDSAWPSGPGLLAFEDNASIVPLIRTVLPSPDTFHPAGRAVCFRAHFNYPATQPALLTFSNRVDDGAVFYVNGVEIKRVQMPPGTVGMQSLALGPSVEDAIDTFAVLATNLNLGDNILAVSVHQSGTNSVDVVFGSTLWAEVMTPLAIAAEPQDQEVQLNQSFSFAVAASGPHPAYQWQFMAASAGAFANIGNATNPFYAQANATTNHGGSYRCVVTNLTSAATSRVARLTLLPDTIPPQLLSAIVTEGTNAIILTFSERLLRNTATNRSNYRITELGGTNELLVTNAALNGSLIQLKIQPWPGYPDPSPRDYLLTVNNLADSFTNVIAPDTRIGVAFWRQVLPMNAFWNWSEDFDLTGQDWISPAYSEATNDWFVGGQWIIPEPTWDPVGRAPFYHREVDTSSTGFSGNTVLTYGRTCYYFRTQFVVRPDAGPPPLVRLNYFADDGAAFYLNGSEVFRADLPSSPIGYSTLATVQKTPFAVPATRLLPVTNCVAGTNVLAVEIHPYSTLPLIDQGIAFGAAVDVPVAPAVAPAFAPQLPSLEFVRLDGPAVAISWTAARCVLQAKSRVEDEWSDLPGATSPFTNAVTATRFFRLRCP